MGSGKTQAAISYINEHPDKRFIYITPYLDEAKRIRDACPAAAFVEPSDKLNKYNFRKSDHIAALIKEGRNIASTHGLFVRFDDDIIKNLSARHYELIIDEAVDVIRMCELKRGDYDLIVDAGWINPDGTRNADKANTYKGERLRDIYDIIKNGSLIDADKKGDVFYWMFTPDVMRAFDNIIVLTYLFDVQILKYYFDLHKFEYEKIGIEHPDNCTYRFTDGDGYIPDYVATLSSNIHIFNNEKLNSIGDNPFALSSSWFDRASHNKLELERLRKNVGNFFTNYFRCRNADERLWSIYGGHSNILRCKGFRNSDLSFNSKATNDYRHKRVLAYCVNVFMNPFEKNYLLSRGVDVKEDGAALSTMIQWIWRSAIRDGKEIWVYIPSKRMRELLEEWIKCVERQYDAYQQERTAAG